MMKRFFALLISLCLVGIIFASDEDYPPITAENVMNLREVAHLGKGGLTNVLAWSSDGQSLALASTHGLYLYDSLDSEPLFIELGLRIDSLLFAGETLFLTDNINLYAYDLNNQEVLYSLEGQTPLALSHNGQVLAYEVDLGVQVLEVATGTTLYDLSYEGILESEETILRPYSGGEPYNNENEFIFAQFYPDDSGLIVRWTSYSGSGRYWEGNGSAGTDLWDFASLTRVDASSRFVIEGTYKSEFQSFAALDATGELFRLHEQSFFQGARRFDLNLFEGAYLLLDGSNLSYAVHGNLVALPQNRVDERGYLHQTTLIVDVQRGEILQILVGQGRLVFSPDGSKITVGSVIYSVETGERLKLLQVEEFELLSNTSDRILYMPTDNSLRLLDAMSLQEIAILPIQNSRWNQFSRQPRDKLYYVSDLGRSAIVFDARTGETLSHFRDENRGLDAVTFSYDSQYMLNPRYLREILNLNTGEGIALPSGLIPESPYFHPNGSLIAWEDSTRTQLLLFDFVNGRVVATFPSHASNSDDIYRLFSPDGRFLVLGEQGNASVWDVENQRLISHIAPLSDDMEISPDNRYLAYLGEAQTIVIFDLLENREINRIERSIPSFSFRFTRDGLLYIYPDYGDYADDTYSVITGTRAMPDTDNWYFAEHNGLRFFQVWQAILVKDTQRNLLNRLEVDNYSQYASLSSDGTRVFVNYTDGRIGVWAVPN